MAVEEILNPPDSALESTRERAKIYSTRSWKQGGRRVATMVLRPILTLPGNQLQHALKHFKQH